MRTHVDVHIVSVLYTYVCRLLYVCAHVRNVSARRFVGVDSVYVYRVAKMHRMPYLLWVNFRQKSYNYWLF